MMNNAKTMIISALLGILCSILGEPVRAQDTAPPLSENPTPVPTDRSSPHQNPSPQQHSQAQAPSAFAHLRLGEIDYTVRLNNGDILTGRVVEILPKTATSPEEGILLETSLGKLTIFASEISEIILSRNVYRHSHRSFIMPTAEPIGDNHFVGLWELLFVYGGVGITEYLSITGGRTVVPFVHPSEQLTLANIKITPFSTDIDDKGSRIFTCIGGNMAFVNEANPFWHLYAGATFKGVRTSITGQLFYKVNEPNTYRVRVGNALDITTAYPQSTIGAGFALDTRFSDRHDVHFIGELWNANILQPSSTALLLGIRLSNNAISMDAGVALFTQPFIAPFVNFAWTPF